MIDEPTLVQNSCVFYMNFCAFYLLHQNKFEHKIAKKVSHSNLKLVFPKANRSSAKAPRSSSGWCERALISSTTAWSTLWAPAPHIGAPPSTRWSTSSRASPRHAPASCHRHLCRRCLGLFQSCDDKSSKNDLLSKVEDLVRSGSPMINEPHL